MRIIDKPASQIKIAFVTAAARSEEELRYVAESEKELLDLGIPDKNIKNLNLDKPASFKEVENFDVIYVCGGNTFYLLKRVRETGFDKVIIEFAKTDKLYLGVSAGSILVCPNIEIASPFDDNAVNLTGLTGLNLIDVIVSPHYCVEEKSIIDEFRKRSQYKVIPLTNKQALLVTDGETRVVE